MAPEEAIQSSNHTRAAAAVIKQVLPRVDELFHRVGRAIPASQQILALDPDLLARDAIQLLRQHYYSQAPVAVGSKVLGVFSFRSFAVQAASQSLEDLHRLRHAPGDLTVSECMEQHDFADLTDELHKHFDALERDNSVLVGTRNNLGAILTPMDVLRYLYKLASPFVYLSEIEHSLRTLIRSVANADQIKQISHNIFERQKSPYGTVPETLEQLTFEQYRLIIASNGTWDNFRCAFGGNRERTAAKLKMVGELRNTLFHFKRPISEEDSEKIQHVRDWLLTRIAQMEGARRGEPE